MPSTTPGRCLVVCLWILAVVASSLAIADAPGTATAGTQPTEIEAQVPKQATETAGPQSMPSRVDPSDEAEGQSQPVREPTAADLEREPALRERAKARWAALIKGDFDAAYEFTTPSFREDHDRESYADSFGDLVKWHLASVQEVRYHFNDEVEVIVMLTISVPLGDSGVVDTEVSVPERWRYLDGQWYFVENESQP